jgi:hypothetical protein
MALVYTYDIFVKPLVNSEGFAIGGFTAEVIPYLEDKTTGAKQPATDQEGNFYPNWSPEFDYGPSYYAFDVKADIQFEFDKIGPFTNDGTNRKYPLTGTSEDGVPPPIIPTPPTPPPEVEKNEEDPKKVKEKKEKEEPIEFYVYGKVVDSETFNPIPEAKIRTSFVKNRVKNTSDIDGSFDLEGEYKPSKPFKVIINAKGYGKEETNPFTLDNVITPNLGIIPLKNNKLNLDINLREQLQIPDIEAIKLKIKFIRENPEIAKQMAINALVTTLKTVVLPMVIKMIIEFGISKASEAVGKKFEELGATCPADLGALNKIIEIKNTLTKQLNNIYTKLETIQVAVDTVNKTLTVADILIKTLQPLYQNAPIAGFGAPDISKNVTPVIDDTKDIIKKFKVVSSSTSLSISTLTTILQQILNLLSLLDSLVEGCAIEGAIPQEQISDDLLAATQQQSQQLSPVVTNVNGFEMSVISIENVKIGGLSRRKAVARNAQGIIMLEGEPSFSSNDQILIDELVYYIKQNDLKAN